jgi:hypothetical protein
MSGRGNPFVVEGMRMYLSDRGVLRMYLSVAGVLGLALLAIWPRTTIEAALRAGGTADTFTVVAVCFLLLLMYISAKLGAEDYSADTAVRLREYVTLTPVSLLSVIGGRATCAVLHTLLFLLIGAPFLAAAMAVGGAGFPQAISSIAVVGAASFGARMCGLLVLTLVDARRPLRDLLLIPTLGAALVVTWLFAPRVNPVHALIFLLQCPDGAAAGLACALANAAVALVLAVSAWMVLSGVRARAVRGGGTGG